MKSQNDSPGVVISKDCMTPLESFYPMAERLYWSRSSPGHIASPRVVLFQDRMTPLESFYTSTE